MKKVTVTLFALFFAGLTASTSLFAAESATELKAKIAELQTQVDTQKAERAQTAKHHHSSHTQRNLIFFLTPLILR